MELISSTEIFKKTFLGLIAQGSTESSALRQLHWEWMDFFELCEKDRDFFKEYTEKARRARAEHWIDRIATSLEPRTVLDPLGSGEQIPAPIQSSEVPALKLEFDKLKFLAAADNPERYGDNKKSKVDINIDLSEFRLLSPQEAQKSLMEDPFNQIAVIDGVEVLSKEKK